MRVVITPVAIFDKAVVKSSYAPSLVGVVIQPEEFKLVLFDDSSDLLFHPLGGIRVRQIQLPAHFSFALIVRCQPIGMLFGYTTVFSHSVGIHPQSPEHTCRVDAVPVWLQTLGKALQAYIPIADRLPPAGFG